MAEPDPIFRRLPGRGASLTHYYSLYQSQDCLLQVSSTGWNETYKRFYYGDIQAIVVRRTSAGTTASIILFILTVPWIVLAIAGVLPILMICLSGLFALPLIYNLMAGQTCVSHIYTAVQAERIPSLGRLRAVERTLARIRPLIEEAQGQRQAATSA